MKNIDFLIIGGNSSIAKYFISYFQSKKITFNITPRKKKKKFSDNEIFFNLLDKSYKCFNNKKYKNILLLAAETKRTFCQNNKKNSYNVNVNQIYKIAKYFSYKNSKIIFFSSGVIYDGLPFSAKANNLPTPICEYGIQKFELEKKLIELKNILILRLPKIEYPEMSFLKNWINLNKKGIAVKLFTDVYINPLRVEDLIKKTFKILNHPKKNKNYIYNISGNKNLSYYEFGKNWLSKIYFTKPKIIKSLYDYQYIKKPNLIENSEFKKSQYITLLKSMNKIIFYDKKNHYIDYSGKSPAIYCKNNIEIDNNLINQLIKFSILNNNINCRICLHNDKNTTMHSMIVLICKKNISQYEFHKHDNSNEYYNVLKGNINLYSIIKDNRKRVITKKKLINGSISYVKKNIYHKLIPQSNYAIFQETKLSPYKQ